MQRAHQTAYRRHNGMKGLQLPAPMTTKLEPRWRKGFFCVPPVTMFCDDWIASGGMRGFARLCISRPTLRNPRDGTGDARLTRLIWLLHHQHPGVPRRHIVDVADQLLLPMALGGLTAFATTAPMPHFQSNSEVFAPFTKRRIVAERDGSRYIVTMR